MWRCCFTVVLLVGLVGASVSQEEGSRLPRVSLVLPPGVASETVQITYFMSGPFGGHGERVKAERNRLSYNIDASVDGQAAARIKVIVYLPGCEITTLDIPLQGATVERQLPCKPLGWLLLRGQILPVSITQEQPTRVEVVYLAVWSNRFFGIFDGPVTTIRIGAVVPDENGQFEVRLPDFSQQMNLGDGEFDFVLRRARGGNIVASLRPAEATSTTYALKVSSSYPPLIQFIAEVH